MVEPGPGDFCFFRVRAGIADKNRTSFKHTKMYESHWKGRAKRAGPARVTLLLILKPHHFT